MKAKEFEPLTNQMVREIGTLYRQINKVKKKRKIKETKLKMVPCGKEVIFIFLKFNRTIVSNRHL